MPVTCLVCAQQIASDRQYLGGSAGAALSLPTCLPVSGGQASSRPHCHQNCPQEDSCSAAGDFFLPTQTGPRRTEQKLGNWHKQFQTIISEDKSLHLGIEIALRGFPRLFMYSVAESHEWIKQTACARPGKAGGAAGRTCHLTGFPWKLLLGEVPKKRDSGLCLLVSPSFTEIQVRVLLCPVLCVWISACH